MGSELNMIKETLKKYKMYEYIRDCKEITGEKSNTKKIILKLMEGDKEVKDYCHKKVEEEKREIEQAMIGKHFHKNMTKREILVNEISQYMYWLTILAVSNNVTYQEFDEENKINHILKQTDITKINEKKPITVKEIVMHDLEQMMQKEYLKAVM